jgi:molybdopterin converting factor small subunit
LDMKITIKSIFDPKETELDTQSATLGALLDELSNNQMATTAQFYDSKLGEIYSDCQVVVNGQSLTDGLNTRLKDGDRVEIYIVMRSGG